MVLMVSQKYYKISFMKIENIEIDIIDIDLTRPYTIAYKTTSSIKTLVVKIILSDGTIGIGASNVSKYVVGLDTTDSYNNSKEYIDHLKGKDIDSFWMIINDIENEFIGDPGSKAGFNLAVYDAYCKSLGISIGKFLGRKTKSLPTSITVGIKNTEETISEINEYLGIGFNHIKIKLGNDVDEDIRRINIINEKFNNKIKIRIDANQGWSLDDTIKFYNETKQIELIEQPLSVDDLANYLKFPSKIKDLIALDESLVNFKDAIKLSSENYGKIFNIKLMKCGGITTGQQIANQAYQNNIDLMWGCNDESIISISAALNTALSFKNTKYLDLDGSFDLERDIVSGGFNLKNGVLHPLDSPGLGVKLL